MAKRDITCCCRIHQGSNPQASALSTFVRPRYLHPGVASTSTASHRNTVVQVLGPGSLHFSPVAEKFLRPLLIFHVCKLPFMAAKFPLLDAAESDNGETDKSNACYRGANADLGGLG